MTASPNGFQNLVNLQQAPAVEGDFASGNPRATVLAGEGGLVAGPQGVTVGRFAWLIAPVGDNDPTIATNYGQGNQAPAGFVHRDQQALIENYLETASNLIPTGFPVILHIAGDFWAKVKGSTAATIGAQAYANFADGTVSFGSAPAGASVTASVGSTNTASLGSTFTATATGTSLAVTALTGYLAVGDTISGTGVPAGTTIVAQVSGTTGAAGTYTTSVVTTAAAATVTSFGTTVKVTATTGLISIGDSISGGAGFPASATVTANPATGIWTISAPGTAYVASATGVTTFGNVLNVTAVGSGVLNIGDYISGISLPANTSIESQTSGAAGGIGVYTLSQPATAYEASGTVTAVGGIATNFYAQSVAAVGELVKISTYVN